MGNILSQDEINALLMGVIEENNEEEGVTPKQGYVDEFQHITKYDFKRPNKFSKDLIRILKGFHDNMARLFSASLSVYLRQDVKIHLTYIEQHTYSEYVDDANEKALYFIISFIDDQAIVSMDIDISLLLIEKLLGGEGYEINVDRTDPTEIEMTILKNILDRMFTHQKESWGEVMRDLPRIITVENNPRLIHLVQPNDIVLKMVFEITIGDGVGIFTYCIPYIALEHVLDSLLQSQFVRMQHQYIKKAEEMKENLENALVDVTAELGTTSATVEEIMSLKTGDILKLSRKKYDDLVIYVGGFKKFGGELGVSDKKYALKLNQIHFE